MKIFKTLLVIMMSVVTQVQGIWGQPNAQHNGAYGQPTPAFFSYGSNSKPLIQWAQNSHNQYLPGAYLMAYRAITGVPPSLSVSNSGTWFGSDDFRFSAEPNAQRAIDIFHPNAALQAWDEAGKKIQKNGGGALTWSNEYSISHCVGPAQFVFSPEPKQVRSYPPRPGLFDVNWQELGDIRAGTSSIPARTSSIDESKAMPPAGGLSRELSFHTQIPSRCSSFYTQVNGVSTFTGSI